MPSPLSAGDGTPDEAVLQAVREQTHLLLGRTIGYSEEDWAQPSRLPCWTRSHVAAHLVANARRLVSACRQLAAGSSLVDQAVASPAQEALALEVGALADGLSLQINLDTTAGELQQELAALRPGNSRLRLRSGEEISAGLLPLVRLHEVVMHSFDLSPEVDDLSLDPDVANQLLAFQVARLSGHDLPPLRVLSHEGFEGRLGPDGDAPRVSGPAADLLLWLARDVVTQRVGGAVALRD